MQMLLHILVDVRADPSTSPEQLRQSTRDRVRAALDRSAVDIGAILSVQGDEDPPVAGDVAAVAEGGD